MKKKKYFVFGKNAYLLGEDAEGTRYYLEEASWDCDWYWGFGYVKTYTNNRNPEKSRDIRSHTHFDTMFLENLNNFWEDLLVKTPFSDDEKYKLLELMKSFYTLKAYSELLYMGHSGITSKVDSFRELVKNDNEYIRINRDLLPKIFEEVYKILID